MINMEAMELVSKEIIENTRQGMENIKVTEIIYKRVNEYNLDAHSKMVLQCLASGTRYIIESGYKIIN